MPGLDPGIHVAITCGTKDVDGRDEPGHDEFREKYRMQETQMPRAVTEIRSLARSYTRSALRVLVGVMGSKDATPAARVAAANAILDRGWGKATQAIESGNGGALELIHRIERVIVHPENPDSQDI